MFAGRHTAQVKSGPPTLELIGGTITADRGWSPHVQGQLDIMVTPSLTDQQTAPGTTLTIELFQRFGDFAFVQDMDRFLTGATLGAANTHLTGYATLQALNALLTDESYVTPAVAGTGRFFELVITGRQRSRGVHSLQLASIEATYQDWLWYDVDANREGVPLTFTASTNHAIVQEILSAHRSKTSNTLPLNLVNLATPRRIVDFTHVIEAGEGTFAHAQRFLTEASQRLYSEGDGAVRLVNYPYTHPSSIQLAEQTNLLNWEVSETRTEGTLVRFQGRPGYNGARPIYSEYFSPSLGRRPHETLIDAPMKPVLGNPDYVAGTSEVGPFLRRTGLDQSPVRLTTVNDYSLMPGGTVTYTLPNALAQQTPIDAITWRLGPRWEMDIWT